MADRVIVWDMGEILNLRRARKAKARAVAADAAAERRMLFGRGKAGRVVDKAEAVRVARVLDGAFVGEAGTTAALLLPPSNPELDRPETPVTTVYPRAGGYPASSSSPLHQDPSWTLASAGELSGRSPDGEEA